MKRTEWIVSVADESEIGVIESANWMQELVRCKDCKFAKKSVRHSKEDEYKCTLSEFEGLYDYHNKDWFCADGERNDENG